MNVPSTIDVMQELKGNLKEPEIRVWMHPKKGGDDFYYSFKSFKDAQEFIKQSPEEAESEPLIAFKGYELNIYAIKERKEGRKWI